MAERLLIKGDEVDCKRLLSLSAFVFSKVPAAGQTHYLTKESPETMFRDFKYETYVTFVEILCTGLSKIKGAKLRELSSNVPKLVVHGLANLPGSP